MQNTSNNKQKQNKMYSQQHILKCDIKIKTMLWRNEMNDTILLRKIHQNNEKISEYCYGPNFPNISSAYYTEN